MYGMSLLENYKTYDRNFFTNRQRLFDFVLFSHEMDKETRIVGFIQRAPICMVCLFSKTIKDMTEISSQIDRECLITYYFRLKWLRRLE